MLTWSSATTRFKVFSTYSAESSGRMRQLMMAPAFWGRQVEQRVPQLIESVRFEILKDEMVRQTFYPSRILVAKK